MKVKHWAGYGCVEATCLHKGEGCTVILVTGNHEQGLEPRYFDALDWQRWLGNRFKINGLIEKVDAVNSWNERTKKDEMEVVFWYKEGRR